MATTPANQKKTSNNYFIYLCKISRVQVLVVGMNDVRIAERVVGNWLVVRYSPEVQSIRLSGLLLLLLLEEVWSVC